MVVDLRSKALKEIDNIERLLYGYVYGLYDDIPDFNTNDYIYLRMYAERFGEPAVYTLIDNVQAYLEDELAVPFLNKVYKKRFRVSVDKLRDTYLFELKLILWGCVNEKQK